MFRQVALWRPGEPARCDCRQALDARDCRFGVELGYLGGAGAVQPEHRAAIAGVGGTVKFVGHISPLLKGPGRSGADG